MPITFTKEEVLQLAGEVRAAAHAGQPVNALDLANRLTLVCMGAQETKIYQFLAEQGGGVETSMVAEHFEISIQQAGTLLLNLLHMDMVARDWKNSDLGGRRRAVWKVKGDG